jgi:DNA-binding CsgD family transcriptional regulator
LTKKEIEVAELMLRGLSAKEIGRQMNISDSTVATHRKAVYNKLAIHSKGELFALERQLRQKESAGKPEAAAKGRRALLARGEGRNT